MKNLVRLFLTGSALALALATFPVAKNVLLAQGNTDGGIIIEATFGSGPVNLNPLLCADTACARIDGFLFPVLVGIDPKTTAFVPEAPGSLAKSWTVSPDGMVYTFKLRTDWNWSDGQPITSADVLYGWQIAAAPNSPSPASFLTDDIEKVEAPDASTVVVTFKADTCTALNRAAGIPVAPSYLFKDVKVDDLKANSFNTKPDVTAGIFKFQEFRVGERTTLVRDDKYPDSYKGKVMPYGYIYNVVPDQTVLVERFLAGELNTIDNAPVSRRADIKALAQKGEAKVYDFPGNSWDYLAMNLADPANPQDALDKDGKRIEQGKHPIFGDVKVRQALAHAIDVDATIKGAVFGEGARMSSFLIPTSWAHDKDIKPIEYDPELAAKMLDEAGWKVGSDGIREKDGVKFKFQLLTNQGNTRRTALGTIVKDELKQIGIDVDFQTIDFNVLIDRQNAQTFDAVILGWRNGFPDDPDVTQLFTSAGDKVGSGSNFTSYYNPKLEELNAQAKSLKGCKQDDRAQLYHQMEKIFQDDMPYIPMYVINGQYAARSTVDGFDPYANQMYWNVDTWTVKAK